MNKQPDDCVCCGKPGQFSIILAVGPNNVGDKPRYYIPNQMVRQDTMADAEVLFCHRCMRMIEDNLRATIMYLQSEGNGRRA
jgi:hypothetical protein